MYILIYTFNIQLVSYRMLFFTWSWKGLVQAKSAVSSVGGGTNMAVGSS